MPVLPAWAYKAIAGLVVFLSLSLAILWFRGEALKARADLTTVKSQLAAEQLLNTQNAKVLKSIQDAQADNARIMTEFSQSISSIRNNQAETNKALDDLEKTDAKARDYLNTPVPDDVARLFDDTNTGKARK